MAKKKKTSSAATATASSAVAPDRRPCSTTTITIRPETIKGIDDRGRFYDSHDALRRTQRARREEFYRANDRYWATGGCGGLTDDEAMIGDTGGLQDAREGLSFLDRLLDDGSSTVFPLHDAVDVGAGVGRITKHVLLKRCRRVRLVEGDGGWCKRSRVYLGRKRAAHCVFVHRRLDELSAADVTAWGGDVVDLVWIQWTLQYLIDDDVVTCLRTLSTGLRPGTGYLVVKENRPYGTAREDRFQMDVPHHRQNDDADDEDSWRHGNQRYDITRTDAHHRLLFQEAGLRVHMMERGVETNTYALTNIKTTTTTTTSSTTTTKKKNRVD